MDLSTDWRFKLQQFSMQLRREFWEHQTLFLGAPAVLALAIFVVNLLTFRSLDSEQISIGLEYLARWFGGASPVSTAPIMTFLALPFLLTLFMSAVIYLSNALYSDRRDSSILFWQSMPISNLSNVLAKLSAVVVVMPGFMVAIMALFYSTTLIVLTVLSGGYGVASSAMLSMLAASLYNLVVVYFYAATTALWLMPMMGWLLLFSAFARKAPLLWAIAAFFLLSFLESFFVGSEVLSYWVLTRIDPDNYLIIDFSGIAARLFSYDMLIGLVIGALLITGSVYMRRFAD